MAKRIDFIDLAKGFCIILVVLEHIISYFNVSYAIHDALKIFRMPLYFFLSGLFFKPYEGFGGFLKRKTNKLLVPFFAFYFMTSLFLPNVLYHLFGYSVRNPDVLGIQSLWAFFMPEVFTNFPIWFLLCLFIVNIFFYCLYKTINPSKSIMNVFLLGGGNSCHWPVGIFVGETRR